MSQINLFLPNLLFSYGVSLQEWKSSLRQVGTRIVGYCCDRPDNVVLRGIAGTVEFCVRKDIEYGELSELFFRSLEDKNVESSADGGGLAREDSEGSKDLYCHSCEESVASQQQGRKNQLLLTRDQSH